MSFMNAKLSESVRSGQPVKTNTDNKVTKARLKLLAKIKEVSKGDENTAFDYALTLIRKNIPQIQQYVLYQGETPADDVEHLALQAYELRCNQIHVIEQASDLNKREANILLEEEESEFSDNRGLLGSLFAPIKIVANQLLSKPQDNFISPDLVSGIINTVGTKINSAELKRAAQNKPAGVIGTLGTGGVKAYNALREYLQKENAFAHAEGFQSEIDMILKGQITDISQLKGYGGQGISQGKSGAGLKDLANDAIKTVEDAKKKEYIKKYLPIAIIGLIAVILITIYVSRKK